MNLETGIIADLLDAEKDTSELLKGVRRIGLKADYFTDDTARRAFSTIVGDGSEDPAILLERANAAVGNAWLCNAVLEAAPSLDSALKRVRELAEKGKKAVVLAAARREMAFADRTATAGDLAARLAGTIEQTMSQLRGVDGGSNENMSFAELTEPIPDEQNPDALIREGWLRRGQGAVLVSYSGVGKSVVSIQLAYAWARGRTALGITPVRPLKIGILQTEDDEEEMKMFRVNIRRGYRELHGWTDDDLTAAERNISMPRQFENPSGEAFTDYLRDWQRRNRFDLVIVNPLQAVCGCDLSNNAVLHDFLRKQINGAINLPEAKCGLLLVHHTNKPPTDPRDKGGFGSDRFAEYVGAGGAEITNWARSILVIKPLAERGRFDLLAAKHGDRLGWKLKEGDKATKPHRVIAHSEGGLVFWREVESLPAVQPQTDKAAEFQKAADQKEANVQRLAADLKKCPRTLTEARSYARDAFGKKSTGTEAYEALMADPAKYGLVVQPVGFSNQSVIGTPEKVQEAIDRLFEQRRQRLQAKTDR